MSEKSYIYDIEPSHTELSAFMRELLACADLAEHLPPYRIRLYTIIDELTSNIVKYGSASLIVVEIAKQNDALKVKISDDSSPFDLVEYNINNQPRDSSLEIGGRGVQMAVTLADSIDYEREKDKNVVSFYLN